MTRKLRLSRPTRYCASLSIKPEHFRSNCHLFVTTQQIDVSVNAPESGTIKEFLVSEEDTVTVGQDLVKLELGGAPEGGKKEAAPEESKEPAAEKPKESAPEPEKPKQSQPSKPAAPEKPKESPKPQPAAESKPSLGNREERRVRIHHFGSPCFVVLDTDGCPISRSR